MRIPYEQTDSMGLGIIDLAEDVLAAILQTVLDGWNAAVITGRINGSCGEVFITERLRDGMREALKKPGHPWGKVLVILPGTESRSRPDLALPDGRTDIPILSLQVFLRTQEHDPHAILECKRLSGSDAHLCREYVVEGMDRFRLGKYGRQHSVGFLVGYVVSGTESEAVDGVNRYLNNTHRSKEQLTTAFIVSTFRTWKSLHQRQAAPSIELHHALLTVSAKIV